MHQPDGYRIMRKAMQKIGRAVERVDNPLVLGLAGITLSAAFFC